jgi:hypothetical protein
MPNTRLLSSSFCPDDDLKLHASVIKDIVEEINCSLDRQKSRAYASHSDGTTNHVSREDYVGRSLSKASIVAFDLSPHATWASAFDCAGRSLSS